MTTQANKTNKTNKTNTTRELTEGLNRRGLGSFIVNTTVECSDGRRRYYTEYFDTKAQALNWIKWA